MSDPNASSPTKSILITVITAIITALITSYATMNFNLKKDIELRVNESKVERYTNMIKYLRKGMMLNRNAKAENKIEDMNKFYEETYYAWLSASDDVIISIREFSDTYNDVIINHNKDSFPKSEELLKNIVLNMRKDVYNKKTNLKTNDFRSSDFYIQ